jgi:predicted MPP superfamily phosphohydrolase
LSLLPEKSDSDLVALRRRLGDRLYAKRLKRQTDKTIRFLHQGRGVFRLERLIPFDSLLVTFFKFFGIREMMRRRFLDVRVVAQDWVLPALPEAFEGFRLLQLTDLHCDLDPALTAVVADLIRLCPHDAAVITGDFRNGMGGDHEVCLRETRRIVETLNSQRWGILGNHDFIEMVPELESMGLPILLNEATEIRRGGASIWMGGIDDPHFYQTHDLAKVRARIPREACAILLSHSPETYREAAGLGFHLHLSGHTHGGQICLPGGTPLVVPCRVPRRLVVGRWSHGEMQGYTSPGTGGCGVAARWNCPPEITVHTLRSGRQFG